MRTYHLIIGPRPGDVDCAVGAPRGGWARRIGEAIHSTGEGDPLFVDKDSVRVVAWLRVAERPTGFQGATLSSEELRRAVGVDDLERVEFEPRNLRCPKCGERTYELPVPRFVAGCFACGRVFLAARVERAAPTREERARPGGLPDEGCYLCRYYRPLPGGATGYCEFKAGRPAVPEFYFCEDFDRWGRKR